MSDQTAEIPLWLQGRDAVIAAAAPSDWREVPDYAHSKNIMVHQRTGQFKPGTLEAMVETLIQVFEVEVSFKKDPEKWVCMAVEQFRLRTNGGPWYGAPALAEKGSYNVLIGDGPFYRARDESFESSHHLFRTAFPEGFFWEVLEVYSPPPVVTVKWRHWGAFTGPYKGFEPTGKTIEMFGMSIARCSEDLRLLELEHFYDNNLFLGQLTGGCPLHKGAP